MKTLLDLNAAASADRPNVRIDGVPYVMRSEASFSMFENRRREALGRRLEELGEKIENGSASEKDALDFEDAVIETVVLVLDGAPRDVVAALEPGSRYRILEAFARLLPLDARQAVEATKAAARKTKAARSSTGANGRRGFRGSTAARRSSGSKARRARS